MSRTRALTIPSTTLPVAARAATAAGALGALAGMALLRRSRRRATTDPNDPAHYDLPAGENRVVRTDDGAELAVSDVGQGPAVVLAHCWMGAREVWAPVAHRLVTSGHRVVLYDQRGHGSSTVGSDGFTIPRLGADLAAVLEALDLREAVLAGHSMGGMTVMSLLAHHPDVARDRGRAAVLVATAAGGLAGSMPRRAENLLASPAVDRLLRSGYGPSLQRAVVGARPCRDHLVRWRDVMVACPADTRIGWLRAMRDMDLRPALASVELPVTILVGSHDRVTPPRFAWELARLMPAARLRVLEGHGHTLPFEAAGDVAGELAEATRATRATASTPPPAGVPAGQPA
ncbi:MAG TPA: alpha/beta hydrolase [Acidimicrobiales bacterium]|nr:alpha/beta hydrolase [Acidimicrobiales bacterium]